MKNEIESPQHIAIFKGKKIRKIIYNDQWYFSIVDVIELLTESTNPRRYWSDLKRKLIENEGFNQLYDKIVQLKIVANDGKMRETETAGGKIAGNARKELEAKSGRRVVSSSNFLSNQLNLEISDENQSPGIKK